MTALQVAEEIQKCSDIGTACVYQALARLRNQALRENAKVFRSSFASFGWEFVEQKGVKKAVRKYFVK